MNFTRKNGLLLYYRNFRFGILDPLIVIDCGIFANSHTHERLEARQTLGADFGKFNFKKFFLN